jgi:predicted AlkP superfamily phosphohydrolase/phosphomutase/tetratricopeptide (TPR) repeat protein
MRSERRSEPGMPTRVLLVGWDAADWQMIRPLMDAGLMPTLSKLLERGASGNLATTRPILSPILWNTIATGRRADAHGVLGFTEPVPDGPGIRPTASTSRRCKALWNILTQCGLRSNVVGWYASHPAEPIAGAMVSNQFEFRSADEAPGAPLPAGTVHPAELAAPMAECRVHPSEVDASAILPFVPDAAVEVVREGNRIGKLMQLVAQTASIHAMATLLMERGGWDFTAVYYEGIDRFGHEFMEFHPPRMAEVDERDFAAYRHCMNGIYRFHDMMLETLLRLAGDDTAVMVISDHGYWNDHRRPDPRPGRAGPVDWHRPFGIFAAGGPGIHSGARVHGASILDVAPTVLALMGLPAAEDMPGRVLAEALDGVAVPVRIPTWEAVPGDCGMHAAELRVDPEEARAALAQLVDLGYIDPLGADDEATRRDTVASNRLQLVQSLVDAGELARALEALAGVEGPLAETDGVRLLRATAHAGLGDAAAARRELDAVVGGGQEAAAAQAMRARLMLAEGDSVGAVGVLRSLAAAPSPIEGIDAMLGRALAAAGQDVEAEESFRRALATEPEDAGVLGALSVLRLRAHDPQGALEFGLRAAALDMRQPGVHMAVGRAFMVIGAHDEAVNAFAACLAQAPGWTEAREALAAARAAAGIGG